MVNSNTQHTFNILYTQPHNTLRSALFLMGEGLKKIFFVGNLFSICFFVLEGKTATTNKQKNRARGCGAPLFETEEGIVWLISCAHLGEKKIRRRRQKRKEAFPPPPAPPSCYCRSFSEQWMEKKWRRKKKTNDGAWRFYFLWTPEIPPPSSSSPKKNESQRERRDPWAFVIFYYFFPLQKANVWPYQEKNGARHIGCYKWTKSGFGTVKKCLIYYLWKKCKSKKKKSTPFWLENCRFKICVCVDFFFFLLNKKQDSEDYDEAILLTRYASRDHWKMTRETYKHGGNGADW